MKSFYDNGFYAAAGIGFGWFTYGFCKSFIAQPERFHTAHDFSISVALAIATILCGNLTAMCLFEQRMYIPSVRQGMIRAAIGALALIVVANA